MVVGSERNSEPNILIPRMASASDLVNAWWRIIDSRSVMDPVILPIPREVADYEVQDKDGQLPDTTEGLEIILKPIAGPQNSDRFRIIVTWDGYDHEGLSFKLSIDPKVDRNESRNSLLRRWKEHWSTKPEWSNIAPYSFCQGERNIFMTRWSS
jgi:hypothetical protein